MEDADSAAVTEAEVPQEVHSVVEVEVALMEAEVVVSVPVDHLVVEEVIEDEVDSAVEAPQEEAEAALVPVPRSSFSPMNDSKAFTFSVERTTLS